MIILPSPAELRDHIHHASKALKKSLTAITIEANMSTSTLYNFLKCRNSIGYDYMYDVSEAIRRFSRQANSADLYDNLVGLSGYAECLYVRAAALDLYRFHARNQQAASRTAPQGRDQAESVQDGQSDLTA